MKTRDDKIRNTTLFASAVALTIASIGTERAAAQATFQALGDLPGGEFQSWATGISADGVTVVGFSWSDADSEAFRWTRESGIRPLGFLPGATPFSFAMAVSGNGAVIVGLSAGEAFRWTEATGMLGLGDLEGGSIDSYACAVSADGGTIVGTSSSSRGQEAFLWTQSAGILGLGDLPGDQTSSIATAVSADGTVVAGVGRLGCRGGCREAFRWTAQTGMTALGDLPNGSGRSECTAVSADGSTIVGTGNIDCNFEIGGCSIVYAEAFRWTEAAGMTGLGHLSDGFMGFAHAVSADGGVIVGGEADPKSSEGSAAFVWDSRQGMRSVQAALVNDHDLDLTGWILLTATGVSADGRIIVGNGINPNGFYEAWIAELPPLCLGDLDSSGSVSLQDLASLLAHHGAPSGAAYAEGDLDGDRDVDLDDLAALLARFGTICE